ncbi:MAG: DUF58 domain-containing protein [Acidobacteriota bacterium]|nr:DUF58 domain-containing protein [Acidobacteriota bacterium]
MPAAQTRFIDPVALARVSNLSLVAKMVVQGFISGLHRSTFLGRSIDFAEHRPYMPGDDIRRLDWRLFARSDRFHVKEFEADTNANFVVAVDVSRSMDFGWRGIWKLDYARFLAGSLAAFSRSQRDRVGLGIFDHELREFVPPSARHLETVLQHLARANPRPEPDTRRRNAAASDLGPPLAQLGAALGRRGLVAVVSDFYEPPEQVLAAFDRLRVTGHDIMAFHVLDPAELDLDLGGVPGFEETGTRFRDLESGALLDLSPTRARERYREAMAEHTRALRAGLVRREVDYVLTDTSTPLDFALFRYLSEREGRRRRR